MKYAYPIILTPVENGSFVVSVPDFDIDTQGDGLANALDMARDAISLVGVDMEDDGKRIPQPSPLQSISCQAGEHVLVVDVDFAAYRRSIETRAVKKTLTIPSWLNVRAEQEGINFSAVLQSALKAQLHLE